MAMYRVKPGCELPTGVEGKQTVLKAGADVDLPPNIAYEVRHLVDEIDAATGEARPIGTSAQTSDLLSEVERARPHEQITLLEQALERNGKDRKLIEERLKAAKAATPEKATSKPTTKTTVGAPQP